MSTAEEVAAISINEIVGRISDYSAIPFFAIGFGITIWQQLKTKSVAEAARDAAKSVQAGLGRGTLILLLPQLQRVEEELERAVQAGSIELSISWLTNWKWQAGQVRGLLTILPPSEKVTAKDAKVALKALQSSVAKAAECKTILIESNVATANLIVDTKSAREAIAIVTNELGMLAVLHGSDIGGNG